MRVCHVITRLIVGGAQENTILTCRGLVEKGHEVTLIAGPETGTEGSLWDAARASGANLVPLNSLRRAVNPVHDFRAVRELTRVLAEVRPDIVHTHSSKAGIVGRYSAHRAGVPTIIHTIHGMSFNRTQSRMVQMMYRTLERLAARWTSGFITVADAMIDQAVTAGLGERERFTTIRSGLEVEKYARDEALRRRWRGEWGIGDGEVVVGTIARLFQNKGYDEILAAMPEIIRREPRLRFVWVGGGPHRERYARRLAELGMTDRVRFTGLVPPSDIPSIINGFDILLHTSRWEGLPRAIVQALLTEVPVVSFDNDGAPEVVKTDESGILARVGEVEALGDAVVRLAADPSLRRTLGANGRSRCIKEFDWRNMVSDIEALYRHLHG